MVWDPSLKNRGFFLSRINHQDPHESSSRTKKQLPHKASGTYLD
jgi:hypothetical protein